MANFGMCEFHLPTKIIFGEDVLKKAGAEARKFGKKALLVTGRSSMRKLGVTDRLRKSLEKEGLEVILYDEVEPNPSNKTIDRGAEIAREESCDVAVALGGGSAMDAAKALCVTAVHGGKIWDYIGRDIPGPGLPFIAIPTTSGTGSEVTPWSVFTNNELKWKSGIGSTDTIPQIGIIDSTLMALMPKKITASSGMDALTHSIEAYTSNISNYISDQFALQSIELASRYLPRAVENGDDMEARSGMALASTMGGIAIAHSGVGAAHAMGMTIGGFFNTDHGVTVGLLLPHIVEYNLSAAEEKYTDITQIIQKEYKCTSTGVNLKELPKLLHSLLKDIGLPLKLSEIGVSEDSLPGMIEDTMTNQYEDIETNPIISTRSDVEQLYKTAL